MRGRDKWNQVIDLKALTASREEAWKQFHMHTALSPSYGGRDKNNLHKC